MITKNAIKDLEKTAKDLEYQQELIQKAITSLNKAKYKFGDFIFTKDGYKGYITGTYSVSYVIYNENYKPSPFESVRDTLNKYEAPSDLTYQSMIDSTVPDEIFYTCQIFKPSEGTTSNNLYDRIRNIIIKEKDIIPYNPESKILYEK